MTPVQIQCPFLYTLLLNCLSFPSICLFPYFRLFASNSQLLPITRTFFDFPWRFKLSGVDCSSHTSKIVSAGAVSRRVLVHLIPSPHSWIFTLPVHTLTKYVTQLIRLYDAPLSRSAWRSFAPLYRSLQNPGTVHMCEQKPVWFSCCARAIWYSVNISLKFSFLVVNKNPRTWASAIVFQNCYAGQLSKTVSIISWFALVFVVGSIFFLSS